jgi:hypothetical protein
MDALTHHDPAPDASAIETAARDMGIIPGDPAYGFVQFMIRSAEADALARQAHLAALAPLLAEVRTLKAEVQQAADKPLMTDHQVKWSVLPALLAAWTGWQVIVGTLLLIGAGLLGMGLQWWLTPTLDCDGLTYQTRPICYRFNGPPVPEAPAAPQPPAQPPAPATPPAKPIQQGKR